MRAKLPFLAGWQYMAEGRWSDVNGAIDQALGEERSVKNLQFKSLVELIGYEDIDAARPYVAEFPSSAASDDLAVDWMAKFYLNTREPEKVLEIVRAFPRDWISTYGTIAPKSEYAGFAQKMAGRPEAARAEWRAALQLIEQRLGDHPNDPDLLIQKAKMLAELGEKDDAMRNLQLYQQLSGLGENEITLDNFPVFLLLGRREETLDWLEKELHEPKHTGFRLHGFARFNFIFDPLRSDPRFQKMMRDTLPAQAKPLD
jgi:tetratricopeptide (TPR) repeat protein